MAARAPRFKIERRGAGDLRAISVSVPRRGDPFNHDPHARVHIVHEQGSPFSHVSFISVHPSRQRGRLGTKLYERAAALACKEFGVPLASDKYRTHQADGFWQKQVRKGRAVCKTPADPLFVARRPDDSESVYGRSDCERYILKCPAPRSLAGARRRRR